MSSPATIPAEKKPLDLKAIFGWSMFDFANSSFTTVMVTAYFSIYFQQVIVPADADGSHDHGKYLWGLANSISQLLVIFTAPLVGAMADFTGAKKKFLFVAYIGCSLMTLTLGWAGPGDVMLGMTLFIIANIFYSSGENIVGAFLPEIAPPHLMGRISGISWGLGYIGGIGALFLSMFILGRYEEGSETAYGWVWVMIGLWFLLAGIPTFLFVKEKHAHETMPPGFNLWTVGFHRLAITIREAARFRMLFRFLIIFMLISVGITAVISFASIIADETLGFTTTELGIFLVVTNVVAVGGAWGWGVLQDRIGSVPAIRLSLVMWLIALVMVIFIHPGDTGEVSQTGKWLFWIAGGFVGIGMGASNSSCRALVGMFSPPDRSGEFFGLWGLAMKLGSVVGPLLFGFVAKQFSDIRVAEGVIGVFFLIGLIALSVINENEGIAAARHGK